MKKTVDGIQSENSMKSIEELIEFVSIPNNVFEREQIQENAKFLKRIMEQRGIVVEVWETPSGRPLIYGDYPSENAEKTILIYGHYDGVPVDHEKWHSHPYEPVLREGLPKNDEQWDTLPINSDTILGSRRLFGRSIADSKNAIVAILSALDVLKNTGEKPAVNIKFLFDGEEEVESPGLPECIEKNKDKLKCDFVISASGELHQSGLPTVELGFRGMLQIQLSVYTMNQDLHSGHFGNFAPNAIMKWVHLLNSFKNKKGLVTIKDFYHDIVPLTESEMSAIHQIPQIEEQIQRQFAIFAPEIENKSLQELSNLPTFNIRGVSGGGVGELASNIIPSHCSTEIDIRLVKGMDPDKVYAQILDHVRQEGFHVVSSKPTDIELFNHENIVYVEKKAGFPATRTPLESKEADYVIQALKRVVGDRMIVMPTEGGSLPLYLFENLGVPVIGLPTSNYDCNQHTHDENLMIDYYLRSIEIFGSLFLGE